MATVNSNPTETTAAHNQPTTPAPVKSAKPKTAPAAAGKKSNAVPTKASKPATKPVATVTAAEDKDAKAKKPKLVRDSFTIPKDEYAAIEDLKQRTAKLAQAAKKSELLRAGLKLLAELDDAALLKAVQAVPSIKTGRPKAEKK